MTATKRAIKRAALGMPIGLAAGLFALTLSGSAGATAGADGNGPTVEGLAWSRDGGHFQASLPEPIVAPGQRLAPGQAEQGRLWVRNDTSADADLVLSLRLAPGAPARGAVLKKRSLTLAAQLVDDEWRSMKVQPEARSIVVGTLAAGAAVPVTVRVALSPGADIPVVGADLHLDAALEDPGGDDSFLLFQGSGGGMSLVSLLVPFGLLVVAGGALVLNRSHPGGSRSEARSAPVRAIVVDDFASYAKGLGR